MQDASLREHGEVLFRRLLTGQLEELWRRSLDKVRRKPHGCLPLRLYLPNDIQNDAQDDLSVLPWEILFDPVEERFLALSFQTPIFRMQGAPHPKNSQYLIRSPLSRRQLALFFDGDGIHRQNLLQTNPISKIASSLGSSGCLVLKNSNSTQAGFIRVLETELNRGRSLGRSLAQARLETFAAHPESPAWAEPVCFARPQEPDVEVRRAILRQRWTVFGFSALLWTTFFHFSCRSRFIPGMDWLMDGAASAFIGSVGGMMLYFVALQGALAYCRCTDAVLPGDPLTLQRRFSLRLPVAFDFRIQGRRINETVFQMTNLLLIGFLTIFFQWHIFYQLVEHAAWPDTPAAPDMTHGFQEGLTTFFPLDEAIDGNFRIGEKRPIHVVNSIPWVPFWGPWFFFSVKFTASCIGLRLLWSLLRPVSIKEPKPMNTPKS